MINLERPRFRARITLLLEAVWPGLWPSLGVVGLFLCAALLDLPPLLPVWAHVALLGLVAITITLLAVRGLRGVRLPDQNAADRRLESASGLTHRPLSVLSDQPARIDAAAMALWQAHVARAMGQIGRLSVGWPRPGLARRDPRALRAGVIVALVACVTIAGPDAPGRIAASLRPAFTPLSPPAEPVLRAWITPPAYTRQPPIFLRSDTPAIRAPAGSHVTFNLTGLPVGAVPALNGDADAFRMLDAASFQADRDLTDNGTLLVTANGQTLAHWDVVIVADQPPLVAWASPPGVAQGGQQTRLPWKVEDDYGVTKLRAELRLNARPDLPPLIIAIPVPSGSAKTAKGASQQDLTAHVWAGLPVTGILIGQDFLGQTGASEAASFDLPERPFSNPVAKILIQVRKGLTLHVEDRGDEMEALDSLMQNPSLLGDDLGAVLNLSGIYYKLVRDPSPEGVAEAQERLWQLALHLEEGRTEATAKALEEARQATREALEQMVQEPNQPNRENLDTKLQELRDAIDRHMQALLDEARRNGEQPPTDPDGKTQTEKELDRLTDRTREAARTRPPEEAQRRMAELEQMLDRLRAARNGQEDKATAEQRQRGRQQMGAVQDMVGREGGLLDHTERRANQRGRLTPNPERDGDRRVQQALRRALGELMQQFGDLTGEVPPSLSEADQAMSEAARQLGDGRDRLAGEAEQQAIEALQRGAQEMGQIALKKFGPPKPGSGDEDGEENLFGMTMPSQSPGPPNRQPKQADSRGRDPLGRNIEQGGNDETGDTMLPEERERQKPLEIQEELHRRGAQRGRSQPELDYIERLLKQF